MAELEPSNNKHVIHILHVDDDPCILLISKNILEMEGNFKVDNATSVDEAFRKLSEQSYDAVVSDYEMPQKNGLDFLKELRAQNNQIPFILFTGKGREDVAMAALNLGADGYFNKQGNPETVYGELTHGIQQNVTSKQVQLALAASEEKFRIYVEASPVAIFVANSEGKYEYVNEAASKLLGYSREELLEMSIPQVAFKEDSHISLKFAEVKETGRSLSELVLNSKDGLPVYVILNSVKLPDGKLMAFCENITERKKMENSLVESQKKFRDLVETTGEFIWEMDLQGKYTYCSAQMMNMWGLEPQEMIGKTPFDLMPPSDRDKVLEFFEAMRSSPKPFNGLQTTAYDGQGRLIFVETNGVPFFDDQGGLLGYRGISRDITEHKKTEQEKLQAKQILEAHINNSPLATIEFDSQYRVTRWSSEAEHVFGWSANEVIGKTINEIPWVYEEDRSTIEDVSSQMLEVTRPRNLNVNRNYRKDRSVIWCEWYNSAIYDELGKLVSVLSNVLDITDRKKVTEDLLVSERKHRELADSLPEIVFEADEKGMLTFLNKKTVENMGYSSEEMKQLDVTQLLVPEDRQRAKDNIKRRMQGEKTVGNEYTILRKDGSTFPGIVFSEKIIIEEGKPPGLRGVIVNISQIKKATEELKQLNEKLLVVGSLTRHDVANKLAVIGSNEYLLRKRIGDKPELVNCLDSIKTAIASSNKLFEFSRFYEKIGAEKTSKENVAVCFSHAVALFPNLGTVKVVNECQGLEVVADSLLRQLFYNLIDNSLKHGEKVTQIRLHYTKDGEGVKLLYEDNGVGVPEANKLKLFEVGFTTGKGSVLGLSLIKKMIDVYGWTITEEGEPGKGAKFTITICETNKSIHQITLPSQLKFPKRQIKENSSFKDRIKSAGKECT